MPFVVNCGESHPWTRRYQTDRREFGRIAQLVRDYPTHEEVRVVERKRIDGNSYVVLDHTTHGFGHNFEPEGEDVACPACGSDEKLRVLSATL